MTAIDQNKVNYISSMIYLLIGIALTVWFLFDNLLIYMGIKLTIPDSLSDMSRIIFGVIFIILGTLRLEWHKIKFNNLGPKT